MPLGALYTTPWRAGGFCTRTYLPSNATLHVLPPSRDCRQNWRTLPSALRVNCRRFSTVPPEAIALVPRRVNVSPSKVPARSRIPPPLPSQYWCHFLSAGEYVLLLPPVPPPCPVHFSCRPQPPSMPSTRL